MNIDNVTSKEIPCNLLDKLEASLDKKGLTFSDLKKYVKVGSSDSERPDLACLTRVGKDAELPMFQSSCLCGHEIRQQCYVCPKNSTNTNDIITFGNRCIGKCGYAPAFRGIGFKVKCECCGSTGLKRHQKTHKCRTNKNTASNVSTSVGSDE